MANILSGMTMPEAVDYLLSNGYSCKDFATGEAFFTHKKNRNVTVFYDSLMYIKGVKESW